MVRKHVDEPKKDGPAATVFLDESTAGPFVTVGGMALRTESLPEAAVRLQAVKASRSVPIDASLHCRLLFHPEGRRKTALKGFPPEEIDRLLINCVAELRSLGASFFGVWVDREQYPRSLRLFEGEVFQVTEKHLAGILSLPLFIAVEQALGPNFSVIYDPDRTPIDWGVAKRQQASHFVRIMENAKPPVSEQDRALLDMADVAAYALSHARLAAKQPGNRKLRRFSGYMNMLSPNVNQLIFDTDRPPAE